MGYRGTAIHRSLNVVEAIIANGGTVSGAVDIGDYLYGAFQTPATITGIAMTFQGSFDGTTYVQVFNAAGSAAESVVIAASRGFAIPDSAMKFKFLKLVSGSAEGAARTLQVMLKG